MFHLSLFLAYIQDQGNNYLAFPFSYSALALLTFIFHLDKE